MGATLGEFLESLFAEGRVAVPAIAPLEDAEIRAADERLVSLEACYRLALPGEPPPLWLPAASWAAVAFFHACQFVVFRDADEAMIDSALGKPCPDGEPASVHYSVDLVFRYLPDLVRLVRGVAENDPFLKILHGWAARWPLSSVGLANVVPEGIEPIVNHPCLLGLYRDGIVARNDRSRLTDRRVEQAVLEAVGEGEAEKWKRNDVSTA